MDLIGRGGDGGGDGDGDGDGDEGQGGGSPDDVETLPPPRLKKGRLRQLWRTRKHLKKRRKYLEEGYVEWYLVDGTWPEPKFVKPEMNSRGIPEVEHDGQRYLFPREAMMPEERQGGRVVIHNKSDSDPINIRDPLMPTLSPDEMEEWLDKGVTTSSPGFFDSLDWDIDPKMLIAGAVALILVISVVNNTLGGGM